jgi:hypothetical protein
MGVFPKAAVGLVMQGVVMMSSSSSAKSFKFRKSQ